ncbi:MAG: hypothetical protein IJQ37_07100 [Clostridia bacterium]|nr:hypothetical protein [Clostridia bacterium]
MYFSEAFNVDREIINRYGTIDISLICDTPLFIDPMLIFNSKKPAYKKLHDSIIRYLHFLAKKSSTTTLSVGDIKNYYTFKEVKENWLGFSLSGNRGLALGKDFAKFFSEKIAFALDTHNISSSPHVEKVMLLYDGTGKDKLSDFTTNLIKGYLAHYTESFAKKYIDKSRCDYFYVERSFFNYETESFVSEQFYLPFIINKKGKKEYVLLTPADILREDEATINKTDLIENNLMVRNSIDNDVLRSQVENYIGIAIRNFEKTHTGKRQGISEKQYARIEKYAFIKALEKWPELYDYYVKLKENDTENVIATARFERDRIKEQYITIVEKIVSDFKQNNYIVNEKETAIDEARERIRFFKNRIEFGGVYNYLYFNNQPIESESMLQHLFKLVWCRTTYNFDSEVNNGTGPVDFKVSLGNDNSSIVEFKLAKNTRLPRVFNQVASYKQANNTNNSLIVIFFFNEIELKKVQSLIDEFKIKDLIDRDIFLIDCRKDNKMSASKL